jgi:hypothetical protein
MPEAFVAPLGRRTSAEEPSKGETAASPNEVQYLHVISEQSLPQGLAEIKPLYH